MNAARDIGLRLEKFEGRGLEEQAVEELNRMMKNSKSQVLLSHVRSFIRDVTVSSDPAAATTTATTTMLLLATTAPKIDV
jgi:hypothetical protein